MTGQTPERIGARTTLQKLLSRFHFGITLFAVALSGLTILLAGVSALRGYADRNMELAAQLGAYGVEPALVFNDPQAARDGLEPLTRIPGIARLRVLNDRGQPLTQWSSPMDDPAPLLTRMFFPRPFAVAIERNGSAIGKIEVWGDSSTLIDYVRIGLLAGLGCLLITALGTIFLARRFEYELVKPLNEIATVAHDVRLHRRFDKRVKPLGIAELDRLGGDINNLLDELQGWQGHMESERAMLAHRASHDTLTAMPNRDAFDEQLAQRIVSADARGERFALLFIDADNFKAANDSFGHAAGDAVLVALREAKVGLWDVIRSAARHMSSDSLIREAEAHDLAALVADLPDLRMIAFNGGKAAAIGRKQLPPLEGITLVDLPSSSAAHTIGFDKKRDRWLAMRSAL